MIFSMTMGSYYRETWWLWVVLVIVCGVLGYYVHPVCFILMPILIAYSVYFGYVRVSEFEALADAKTRQARPVTPPKS